MPTSVAPLAGDTAKICGGFCKQELNTNALVQLITIDETMNALLRFFRHLFQPTSHLISQAFNLC